MSEMNRLDMLIPQFKLFHKYTQRIYSKFLLTRVFLVENTQRVKELREKQVRLNQLRKRVQEIKQLKTDYHKDEVDLYSNLRQFL